MHPSCLDLKNINKGDISLTRKKIDVHQRQKIEIK